MTVIPLAVNRTDSSVALISAAIRPYDDSGMSQVRKSVASGLWKPRVTSPGGHERLAGGGCRCAGSAGCQGVAGSRRDDLDPRRGRFPDGLRSIDDQP